MKSKNQIEKILTLLEKAKSKNERIAVLGDFDTDGITGSTIFYKGLKDLGFKFVFLDLSPEGFSLERVKKWVKKGISLGVLIDTGSKKYKEVKLAKKNKIKIIIIDHHQADKYPDAPLYYSFKKAACQLSYEVIKKLYEKEKAGDCSHFLSLAAIGTLADRIPITKADNSVIKKGLEQINEGENKGIKFFLRKIKVKEINIDNQEKILNYFKFPKGRNENNIFYKLFTSSNELEIKEITEEIIKNYRTFKKMIDKFTDKISPTAGTLFVENKITPFVPGLSGTVAEFILEKFGKPVFVYKINKNSVRFSSRFPKNNRNLLKLLKKCSKFFETYGGHPYAAGFRAKKENLEEIKKCLEDKQKTKD